MMTSTIAAVAGILGVVISLITIASTVWKASSAIAELRRMHERLEAALRAEIATLQHENDKMILLVNGVREVMEHTKTRLLGDYRQLSDHVEDIEGYLQKNTPYERRKNR